MTKKGDDAFVFKGFDNWKKAIEKFCKHASSDAQKEAILKVDVSQ